MIMVPRRSNHTIKFVVDHELEFDLEFLKKARRIVLYELGELEFLLENESIQSDEEDKIRSLIRHLEFIVCFIGNSDDYPALQKFGISDLVFDIVSVIEGLFVDIESYALDEDEILDRSCFLHHSYKVENLVKKIESVKEEKLLGSLSENLCLSYSIDEEAVNVIGFEDKQSELRERLVRTGLEEEEKVKLEVIPIVGMAGIGKTTLTSMLYNHPSVIHRFPIRVWICLSKSYKKKNILHDILSCIVSENDPILLMSVDDMGEKVYSCLRENRYLIVLDDIWDVRIWNDLRYHFPKNINGSKILMTSRIEDVALNIEGKPYFLPRLTEDKSWFFFQNKVFGNGYISMGLSEIGKEIVAKCNGLPLLIDVLAKLLPKEDKIERYWRQVAENMSSIIYKIMDSPCSNHILIEMLVDHQFITMARRDVELELENLELLLDHESLVFSRRDEILSLVQDLKSIHSFIRNVQETPTLQTQSILDFVLEIKYVVEEILDDTESYIRSKIFRDLEYCHWKCFLRYCQKVADMVSKIECIKKVAYFQGNGSSSQEALSIQEACSSSILEGNIVIGFDDQQKELLDRLIGGRKQLEVVPIIGMAGIGKTTLTNMLYNHLAILCHFHVRAWTCLSQSYQKKNLLHDILSSIVCEDDPVLFMSEDDMGEKLYKSLMGNRYLIVLDDIWDFQAWTDMERYFPNNENGSRILMTSRIEDVALNIRMKNSCPYYLPILSEDKSWELFQCKVFCDGKIPEELKEIGKRIVARCKGLPLAIVVIAGLLSKEEKTEQCWRHVGENIVSSSINNNALKQLMDILALSYKHLPSPLKSCFLYFGLFPEDSEIPVSTLIRSWIAEGFIQQTEDNKRLEEVAEEFLLNLVSRNLVMVAKKSTNGGIKSICIHDLLRDMCLQMGEEKKHLQLICRCASNSDLFYSKTFEGKHAPGFSYCQYYHFYKSYNVSESDIISTEVLSVYKYLQVLDLRHMRLFNFDWKILELLHLKFLALQVVRIETLPNSLFDLWNLETFILEGEKGGKLELTPKILKMNKLRHFQISQELFCDEVKWMDALQGKSFDELRKQWKHNPVPMILLDNLQTFSTLSPSNFVAVTLLPRFQSLRKLGLHLTLSETTAKDVLFPDLSGLNILENLNFEYQTFGMVNFSIPHPLIFPPSLKKLTLIGTHCKWREMSILGMLQNLEVLKLKDNSFSGPCCCWETCDDGFPQLKYLKLSHMDLQQWISSSSHFPKLQHLVLNGCLDLEQIPLEIGDILTLQTIEVYRSSDSAAESAKQILEIQNSVGNEFLKVFIYQQFQEF